MKTCVNSYSFCQLMGKDGITQLECISKAKELGFDAIEFTEIMPPEGVSPMDWVLKLKEECAKEGMPIANVCVGADFIYGSNGDLDAEVERVKGVVDLVAALGAPSMRHDATGGWKIEDRGFKGFDQALPRLVEGCRRVTEYAAAKGVKTMVENHGIFCQDSTRVEKLVNGVAHENFGLLNDMGNFLCADEDPALAISRAAPYAFHVHAKDFHVKSPMLPSPGDGWFCSRGGNYLRGAVIGHGNVPVVHCLKALKLAGYNGYVSIEFEGIESCMMALKIGVANLKRYIEMA